MTGLNVDIRHNNQITSRHIMRAVIMGRRVARWNGNRTWNRGLVCVTDDLNVVRDHLHIADQRLAIDLTMNGERDILGTTWYNCGDGIIWLSPKQRLLHDITETLNHEISHILAKTQHGHTWRRMHTMLMPLTTAIIRDIDDIQDITQIAFNAARSSVISYRRSSHYYSISDDQHSADVRNKSSRLTTQITYRAAMEIEKHVDAAVKCWRKFRSDVKNRT